MNRQIRCWLGAALLLTSGLAPWVTLPGAEQPLPGQRQATGPSEQRSAGIENKLKLLGRLANKSTTAKRIRDSSNVEAIGLLADARLAWQQAVLARDSQDLSACELHLRQGLEAMSAASRMVKDDKRVEVARQQRYQQLQKRVSSFSEAYERVLAEKSETAVGGLLDQTEIRTLVKKAEFLAQKGDYMSANKHLVQAANAVEAALAQARNKETLVHQLKFESDEDEYAYELQRNNSNQMLIVVVNRKTPAEGTKVEYIEKLVDENDELRREADVLFKQGQVRPAIEKLEKGTEKLTFVLRLLGVSF